MIQKNEFREHLLKLLTEIRHRDIRLLVDSDLFSDAYDLFEEEEVEEAVIERADEEHKRLPHDDRD